MRSHLLALFTILLALAIAAPAQTSGFVTARGGRLYLDGKPYYFVGTNYWYGSLLGLEPQKRRGINRLRHELDFLKKNGVTNLRLMAAAEGAGLLNGTLRVGPPIQPRQGKFDERALKGLDIVLAEMGKRGMKAVIFLSNNWEWSGGFQQYLLWNHAISDDLITTKPTWDDLRDTIAKFYTCEPCISGYRRQAETVVGRRNTVTKKLYSADPAIMAWEIANEPRPMRAGANDAYKAFLASASAWIKAADKRHLVTTGHEGWIGTEGIKLFEAAHADPNIDYLTIHIWPKNWGWFKDGKMAEDFSAVSEYTAKYVETNVPVAKKLDKPMVIEEFGLPRDEGSLLPGTPTTLRDRLYSQVLSYIGSDNIAGASFWAFAGSGRPAGGRHDWKPGDDRTGDPPMEEQGLNSVFDKDESTWLVISGAAARARNLAK